MEVRTDAELEDDCVSRPTRSTATTTTTASSNWSARHIDETHAVEPLEAGEPAPGEVPARSRSPSRTTMAAIGSPRWRLPRTPRRLDGLFVHPSPLYA
jgi:hypothetical protein